jgi:hypothetical protein
MSSVHSVASEVKTATLTADHAITAAGVNREQAVELSQALRAAENENFALKRQIVKDSELFITRLAAVLAERENVLAPSTAFKVICPRCSAGFEVLSRTTPYTLPCGHCGPVVWRRVEYKRLIPLATALEHIEPGDELMLAAALVVYMQGAPINLRCENCSALNSECKCGNEVRLS